MDVKKEVFTRENFRAVEFGGIRIVSKTHYVRGIDNYLEYYYIFIGDEKYKIVTQLNSALEIANLLLALATLRREYKILLNKKGEVK